MVHFAVSDVVDRYIWYVFVASDVAEVEDPEELEVYGEAAVQTGTELTQYTFEVQLTVYSISRYNTEN